MSPVLLKLKMHITRFAKQYYVFIERRPGAVIGPFGSNITVQSARLCLA